MNLLERVKQFSLETYEYTYRLFYFCFFLSIAPYVFESIRHYDGVPDRFIGEFYFAPFWIGWGLITLLSCAIAMAVDSVRAQGMCISLTGTWYLFRVFANVFDGADPQRFYRACLWFALFLICTILSYHLSHLRPTVRYMAQIQRERELEQQLYEMEEQRAKAEEGG